MFNKIITTAVTNSLKNNRYFLSRALISIYNKLNIPVNPLIFNIQSDGKNALDGAISSGNHIAVRTFLENGAKLNLDVSKSVSCLNTSIISRNLDLLDVLLEHIYSKYTEQKTSYDENVISLLTATDITNKSPLLTACDIFLNSNNEKDKDFSKNCINLIYNNPLFDKNISQFYNNKWKKIKDQKVYGLKLLLLSFKSKVEVGDTLTIIEEDFPGKDNNFIVSIKIPKGMNSSGFHREGSPIGRMLPKVR